MKSITDPRIRHALAQAWLANLRLRHEIARANRLCHGLLPAPAALASFPPPSKGRGKKSFSVSPRLSS